MSRTTLIERMRIEIISVSPAPIESDEITFLTEIPTQDSDSDANYDQKKDIPCFTIEDEAEVITLSEDDDDNLTLNVSPPTQVPTFIAPNVPPTPPQTPMSPAKIFPTVLTPITIHSEAGTQTALLCEAKPMPKLQPIPPLSPPITPVGALDLRKMPILTPIMQPPSIDPEMLLKSGGPLDLSPISRSPSTSDVPNEPGPSRRFAKHPLRPTIPDIQHKMPKTSMSSSTQPWSLRLKYKEHRKRKPSTEETPLTEFHPKAFVDPQKPKLKSILKLPLGQNIEETRIWVYRIRQIMEEKDVSFHEADRLEEEERKEKKKNRKVTFKL